MQILSGLTKSSIERPASCLHEPVDVTDMQWLVLHLYTFLIEELPDENIVNLYFK